MDDGHTDLTPEDISRLATPGLTAEKCLTLCRLGNVAYKSKNDIRDCLKSVFSEIKPWTDNGHINNQGFLAWEGTTAVLSFRGTDSTSDWRQNTRAFFTARHDLGGRRHNGFADVWDQRKDLVYHLLNEEVPANTQL